MLRRIFLIVILFLSLQVAAEEVDYTLPRPVTSTYSIELGGAGIRETYVSPMRYDGIALALAGNWQKAMPFAPRRALMDFDARAAIFPRLINPGGNALMQSFELEFFWGMGAYFRLPYNLSVSVEGGPQLLGGTAIILRNSNNPVGVNLSATLAAKGELSWRGHIGALPVSAGVSVRLPLTGAFFMPGYGETFYEILVGNRSGLVHTAWPGNHFRINMLCAFRMDFGRTALEVGYRLTAENTRANNLTNRLLTNCFSIGVIPGGLGLKNRRREIRPH